MPPYLSLPGLPDASHLAAWARSKASIGSRRHATTKVVKSGESGQPCVTPSFMRSRHHVPSDYLWCKVFGLLKKSVVSGRSSGKFSTWRKPPRKVSYNRTFGTLDRGLTLDVWESQTTESAVRWRTHHIAPRHILELTLEVIFEVILEHVLRIKTMTSLILDHVVRAYLCLVISTGEKVMILLLSHSLGVVTGQNKTS